MIEQYKCKSYIDDNLEVQDCECGKCGYEHNLRRWKEAYTDVLKVCDKYAERFKQKYASEFSDIHEMSVKARDHLMLIEWYEKYGLKIEHDNRPHSYGYFKVGEYMNFNRFNDAKKDKAEGSGCFISWPDDGRQPKNEWLLYIRFSTGPFIFGKDYEGQKQLFRDFFDELKSYKPDYRDTANRSLYWKLDNAKGIFDDFNAIMKKYRERNQSELKQREAEALRKKLAKLDSELAAKSLD